jgi:hypothetical protein
LLQGGAALAGLSALEYTSLSGHFDHTRPIHPDDAPFLASLLALEDPKAAARSLVHIGHSTHLLSIGGVRMVTDPWFYDPAFGALTHLVGPAVRPEDTGDLGMILVTHDHADHADPRALGRMDKRAVVYCATNDHAAKIRDLGYSDVRVPKLWEEIAVDAKGGAVTVTAVPGIHDIYEVGFVVKSAEICVFRVCIRRSRRSPSASNRTSQFSLWTERSSAGIRSGSCGPKMRSKRRRSSARRP